MRARAIGQLFVQYFQNPNEAFHLGQIYLLFKNMISRRRQAVVIEITINVLTHHSYFAKSACPGHETNFHAVFSKSK